MSIAALRKRLDRLEPSLALPEDTLRPFPTWLEPEVKKLGLGRECDEALADGADWKYQTLPAQRAFHSDLISRFKGYSGPIGSGKSHALVYEALLLSRLNPGLLGLIAAPTYKMLSDSTQRTFFDVLSSEGIEYVFYKQESDSFSILWLGDHLSQLGEPRATTRTQPGMVCSRRADVCT